MCTTMIWQNEDIWKQFFPKPQLVNYVVSSKVVWISKSFHCIAQPMNSLSDGMASFYCGRCLELVNILALLGIQKNCLYLNVRNWDIRKATILCLVTWWQIRHSYLGKERQRGSGNIHLLLWKDICFEFLILKGLWNRCLNVPWVW